MLRRSVGAARTLRSSVVHQEAHDGNVFLLDGSAVFIDWAEASVGAPVRRAAAALAARNRAGRLRARLTGGRAPAPLHSRGASSPSSAQSTFGSRG